MRIPSKAKGNRFETNAVKKINKWLRNAKRAWGSNGAALGHHPEVDIIFDVINLKGEIEDCKVQAKCRKALPSYIKPNENVDIQIIKEDRGDIFVVIELDKFMSMIKEL